MSTPPELELLNTCVALAGGIILLWTFFKNLSKPTRITASIVAGLLLVTAAVGFGYRVLHKAPAAVANTTPAPKPAPAARPAQASTQVQHAPPAPRPHTRRAKPAAQPARVVPPASAPVTTVGSDSTVYGTIPQGTRVGDRSVYVGATDAHGNTKVGGGSAIGYGASADPSSVAIGANAHAGGAPVPAASDGCIGRNTFKNMDIHAQYGMVFDTLCNDVEGGHIDATETGVTVAIPRDEQTGEPIYMGMRPRPKAAPPAPATQPKQPQ